MSSFPVGKKSPAKETFYFMEMIFDPNLSLLNELNGIFNFFFGKIVLFYLTLIIIPSSFHSSYSRLEISGSWVRACGSLNPPSSSLKVIIFWVRDSLNCKMLVSYCGHDVFLLAVYK